MTTLDIFLDYMDNEYDLSMWEFYQPNENESSAVGEFK